MRSALRRLTPYLLLASMLVGSSVVWWNREYIRDKYTLRDYTPDSSIAQLASDDAMTDYAKRLFYVNKPTLQDKTGLNQYCSDAATDVAVLGCYLGNRQGIYVFDVTDVRLHGIEQVTAAHEMLHQAYERLDQQTRGRIDALLQDYYDHELTDTSVKDKINSYKKSEPGELTNEMHSIFGTEIAHLPTELETYYTRYFTDRQQVISFRNQSQSAFDVYFNQIARYDAQLEALKAKIDAKQATLSTTLPIIEQKKAALEVLLKAGQVAQYNAGVPEVQNLVKTYNAQIQATNQLIDQYNQILAERKTAAVQVKSLGDELDTRLPQ